MGTETNGSKAGAIVPDEDGSGSDHPSNPSHGPFNWPALVATILAAEFWGYLILPPRNPTTYAALAYLNLAAMPLVILFGLLGRRRKYLRKPGRVVATVLTGLFTLLLAGYLLLLPLAWALRQPP